MSQPTVGAMDPYYSSMAAGYLYGATTSLRSRYPYQKFAGTKPKPPTCRSVPVIWVGSAARGHTRQHGSFGNSNDPESVLTSLAGRTRGGRCFPCRGGGVRRARTRPTAVHDFKTGRAAVVD